MISNKDKNSIEKIAKKYNVSKLYLFGSSLDSDNEARDIDLAVEGIENNLFFKFYSELIFNLSKPVDIIDLSKKSAFCNLVRSEGILIYE